jgi:hypothetical protein
VRWCALFPDEHLTLWGPHSVFPRLVILPGGEGWGSSSYFIDFSDGSFAFQTKLLAFPELAVEIKSLLGSPEQPVCPVLPICRPMMCFNFMAVGAGERVCGSHV